MTVGEAEIWKMCRQFRDHAVCLNLFGVTKANGHMSNWLVFI